MSKTADDILLHLKTRGAAAAGDLASRLGISRQAVRQQIERLTTEGLVASAPGDSSGVGRPSLTWSLTDKGHQRFPDTHAQMTVEILDAVRAEFGAAGLDRLVARREGQIAQSYALALAGAADMETRLDRLAALRTAEGYMCTWSRAEDGGWLLVENHCPICAAAAACQGFCRSELALFRSLLSPARVERTDHILAGARRCAYRIED